MNTYLPELTQPPLIGEQDPAPYEVINPDGTASMLLVCDHASRAFPQHMGLLGLAPSALDRHIAYDIGAEAVTRQVSKDLDAMAVLAGYSRLLIDVNRQPGDPSSIPEISDLTPIPGNMDLTEEQQMERVESFFWPYHHAVANAMTHLWHNRPPPALFSIHSFTPSLGGKDRHWDIGVLWNRDHRLGNALLEKLRIVDNGRYHVGDNEPYSGKDIAYTIDFHAGAAGLPNCAVEIRQDHLETPEGVEHWAQILTEAFKEILTDPELHTVQHF